MRAILFLQLVVMFIGSPFFFAKELSEYIEAWKSVNQDKELIEYYEDLIKKHPHKKGYKIRYKEIVESLEHSTRKREYSLTGMLVAVAMGVGSFLLLVIIWKGEKARLRN